MEMKMRQERIAMNSSSRSRLAQPYHHGSKHMVTEGLPKFDGYRKCKPLKPLWKKRKAFTLSPDCSRSQENAKSIIQDQDRLKHSKHFVWRTTNRMLEVPPLHYLFDSAITLQNIPVEVIGSRISNFMRVNSIACKYGKCCADIHCTTANMVKFVVQLWRSSTCSTPVDGDENRPAVIMDLQRRRGCVIEIHNLRNALYHAVMTGENPVVPNDHANNLAERIHKRQTIPSKDLDSNVSNALTIALNLMKSKLLDQKQLGMENLKCLTDCTGVSQDTAKVLSNGLVYGKTECGKKLRDVVLVYFRNVQRPQDLFITEEDFGSSDDEAEEEYSEGNFHGVMHRIALQVLANALEVASLMDSCSQLDIQDSFWKVVLEALVYDIAVSTHRPHEAALSAKCASIIQKKSPSGKRLLHDRIEPLLAQANDYGKKYHLGLERETQILMGP